jgi:hypothetical protein
MRFHDAAQLQPLQLHGSFAFTGRLLLVGLPLDRRRISSRARPVPRNRGLACAAARRARSDRCRLGRGHPAQPGGSGAGATKPEWQRVVLMMALQHRSRSSPLRLLPVVGRRMPSCLWRQRQGLPCNQRARATWRRSAPRSGERLHWWIRNRRQLTGDSWPATAGKLLIPTLNDQEGDPRRWPLPRVLASLRAPT